MSTIIKVRCIDQVLTFDSTPIIASGGVEEDFLQVEFCPKWDGLAKTAVFWSAENEAVHVLLDEENSCAIPPEVLLNDGVITIGLYGVNPEGKQRTSLVVRYTVEKGAITRASAPENPTADLYTQLLAAYADAVARVDGVTDTVNAAAQRAEDAATAAAAAQQSAAQAVPQTRTVNGKALSSDISLTAANVGAVPTTRKVNGKALSADISITLSDLGALGGTVGSYVGQRENSDSTTRDIEIGGPGHLAIVYADNRYMWFVSSFSCCRVNYTSQNTGVGNEATVRYKNGKITDASRYDLDEKGVTYHYIAV